jgi:hypothetical protein
MSILFDERQQKVEAVERTREQRRKEAAAKGQHRKGRKTW